MSVAAALLASRYEYTPTRDGYADVASRADADYCKTRELLLQEFVSQCINTARTGPARLQLPGGFAVIMVQAAQRGDLELFKWFRDIGGVPDLNNMCPNAVCDVLDSPRGTPRMVSWLVSHGYTPEAHHIADCYVREGREPGEGWAAVGNDIGTLLDLDVGKWTKRAGGRVLEQAAVTVQ